MGASGMAGPREMRRRFPKAKSSRVAEELEGYGAGPHGRRRPGHHELRGGHFVPTGEDNDVIKNRGKSCSETQSTLSIISPV